MTNNGCTGVYRRHNGFRNGFRRQNSATVAGFISLSRVRRNVASLSWYNFTDGSSEELEPQ
jgi:hypothetical protein